MRNLFIGTIMSLTDKSNEKLMELLCIKHKKSPTIGQLFYSQIFKDTYKESIPNVEAETNVDNNYNIESKPFIDLLNIQNNFLQTYSITNCFDNDDLNNPVKILKNESLVLKDEVFVQHCQKALEIDSRAANIFSKIVLLPKLNNSIGKMPEFVATAVMKFFITHEAAAIDGCFFNLISLGDSCNNYSVFFDHIFLEAEYTLDPKSFDKLIRALSEKTPIEEMDLQTFSCLIKQMDLSSISAQRNVTLFLEKHSKQFANSVKFGRCLLCVLQKIGNKLFDKAVFNSIINTHKSSMKKAIQVQYVKATSE